MISFACFSPHPPILLPSVGSENDRSLLKNTISSLDFLGKKLEASDPGMIIISSPHAGWGFDVPLYFLAKNFQGQIKTYLTGFEDPEFYFKEGLRICLELEAGSDFKKIGLIASGDMSHCLKEDGPYGFNPEGPKFDGDFQDFLEKKEIKKILQLSNIYPNAGECGLRSFAFLLGILEASKTDFQPQILSYENPFGVGYLTVDFKLEKEALKNGKQKQRKN